MANRIYFPIASIINDYHRRSLIESNQRKSKDGDTVYSLCSVDFNPTTRRAKVVVECTKQYRTIERYVTCQYQKYPVYSDWKYKTTNIKKNVRLTNENLEMLNQHEDELVREFSAEIIESLGDEDLIPSWLFQKWLHEKLIDETSKLDNKKHHIKREHLQTVEKSNNDIGDIQYTLEQTEKKAQKRRNSINKIIRKIEKIHIHKKSVLISIFTFFIYSFLNSSKRERYLTKKQEKLEQIYGDLENQINSQKSEISAIQSKIDLLGENVKAEIQELDKQVLSLNIEYGINIKQITPLLTSFEKDNDFIPLKVLCGMKYEKIVGCYIIHNTEKNKYYIGQSKDVMKRLKSHFKGTVPNNIIFAEDYFSSQLANKDDLFAVKVLRL
ncbi:MAG: GIY-YIG nuclease family protein, partial [Oscillospiraceae bacterium]|nr:GIY-YIG nuclease family protein [Oscillospiraceae bacterium]